MSYMTETIRFRIIKNLFLKKRPRLGIYKIDFKPGQAKVYKGERLPIYGPLKLVNSLE